MSATTYYSHHLFICCNQRPAGEGCCNDLGATALFDYAKARAKELGLDKAGVRINKAGCLGRCEKGPVLVIYPEGVWYSAVDQHDIEEILTTHLRDGGIVERLRT
jgi:(2Fe-2S) ferredoxin